jgi:hypothetical protein
MEHKKNKYDYAVIGAGLTGTIIAKGLSRQGAKVLLLEATEAPGEASGLMPMPESDLNTKNIEFFQMATGLPVTASSTEFRLKTFDSGSIKDFLGFGDQAPEYIDLMTPFLASTQIFLSPGKEDWIPKILSDFTGDFQKKSYVTAFEFEQDKIKSFMINGQTRASADQIVFAGALPQVSNLVPAEHWNAKPLSKFGKMKSWTAVGLDLQHSAYGAPENELSESGNSDTDENVKTPELWVLKGTPQDEHLPCVGVISPDGKTSHWMTWIKDIDAEDTEEVAQCLKRIKRQIKQAFPEILTKLDFERIYVQPSWAIPAAGTDMLPQISNLHFASSQLASQPGVLGGIERATVVLKEMGFTEASFPELQTPETPTFPAEEMIQASF